MTNYFTIGLPVGKHLRPAVSLLLKRIDINIPEYMSDPFRKIYRVKFKLPSGAICKGVIDKPRDLLFSLLDNTTDIIITGEDYLADYRLFTKFINTKHYSNFQTDESEIVSAHISSKHLNFFGLQLAFIVNQNSPWQTLADCLCTSDKIICYSEFPMIAAQLLKNEDEYKKRYGNKFPTVYSTFSKFGDNPDVIIVYSNGATESKLKNSTANLILDLVLTANTINMNNLRVLTFVENKIYNYIYRKETNLGDKELVLNEFVTLIEKAIT